MYLIASSDDLFKNKIHEEETKSFSCRKILFCHNNASGLRSIRAIKYNIIIIDTDKTAFDLKLFLKNVRCGKKEVNKETSIILVAEKVDKKYVERYIQYVEYISLKSTFDLDQILAKSCAS